MMCPILYFKNITLSLNDKCLKYFILILFIQLLFIDKDISLIKLLKIKYLHLKLLNINIICKKKIKILFF